MKRLIVLSILLLLGASSAPAREVFPLNDGWLFFFESENSSENARSVTLPHSWNTDPRAEGALLETTGKYVNTLFVPQEWTGRRLFVRFYGVQSVADLSVNGRHAGSHRGGGTAFAFEITDKVRFGADNVLMMTVSNASRSDVLPASTDMNRYGGIYREAELILTEQTTVSPLYLGTEGVLIHPRSVSGTKVDGEAEIHLSAGQAGTGYLTLAIDAPDGERVFTWRHRVRFDGKPVTVPFGIDRPRLWSPDTPDLYTVSVSVGEQEERTTDSVAVRTGFRDIAVGTAGGFTVNGIRTPLRGVALYHDNARSGGALTAEDLDDDLRQLLDLGANALRSAVMPHDRRLYDRCDELGLLVWVDLPFHRVFLSDTAYLPTAQFEQNGMEQLREIIAQHINHPSVVMWGLFSRLWMRGDDPIPYIERLNETAHKMDPSRPTVACSDQNGGLNFITDLIVLQQNVGWERGSTDEVPLWRDRLRKNWTHLRPAVAYGGAGTIGLAPGLQPGSAPDRASERRQARFHEEYARHLTGDSLFWGVWINNLFDYGAARLPGGLNREGLVTLDRRGRKDAYYLYRALWNGKSPTLHLADKHRTLRADDRQSFRVYSSAGMPQLVVGADTVALTEYAPCQYRSDTVSLGGRVEVKVAAGTLRDSVTLRIGSVPKPKRHSALRRTAGPQTTD